MIREYNRLYQESIDSVEQQEFIDRVTNNYEYIPAPLCPKCNSRYHSERTRKKPRYLCQECRLEFDEPKYKTIEELIRIYFLNNDATDVRSKCLISKDKWMNKHNLSQVKYWLQRDKTKNIFSENIGKDAFLLYLNDNIKYLSFEDTITACKKCAFNYDLNNLELCPKCKKYYKGIPYPTCINCLPDDKRTKVIEKVKFGRTWQTMHQELGIE